MQKILVLCCVAIAALVAPANADGLRRTDRDDSPGRLDIASTAHGHGKGELVFRVRTYEAWKPRDLTGYNRWIVFPVSTNDDPKDPEGFERYIWVDYKAGRLRAVVLRKSEGMHATADDRVGPASVERPNRRTVVVRVRKRLLGEAVRNYRWYGWTSWESRRGPCEADGPQVADNPHPFGLDGSCFDHGPELRHHL